MKKFLLTAAALLAGLPAAARQDAPAPTLPLEDCRIRAAEGFPGIKARCGTFERLENPADPDSPLLALHVAVVPALSLEPEPDAFLPIAGGPGQSTVAFYASVASAFEDVRRTRDIVLLDQRGTGDSAPLRCEVDEDIIEGRYSREQTIEETVSCLKSLPHDPRYFTTSIAVQDIEALRQALGYSQWNVYGISYGSRVAQHFLRQYPESTRTVVLDGIAAPQIALGPGIAIESQDALDVVFVRCVEDAACNERFPDLRSRFDALRASLEAEPVTLTMPDPLTGRQDDVRFSNVEMAGAIRLLLYHPSSVALIPLLVSEAIAGNYQPLAAQFRMVAATMSEAINIGMHNAVICTEDAPWFASENVTRAELEATYMGPLQLDALEAMCSVWPAGVIDEDFKLPVASNIPVLLLSGEVDPITPPAYADLAAVDLGNALHLTGKRQGHGLAPRGCTPRIIGDFVMAASVKELDTECLERVHAMPFFLDFSGPSP